MTDKLYLRDSYLKTFDAKVIAHDAKQHALRLDRSAFYPGGGGQPADRGQLIVDDVAYPVRKAARGDLLVIDGDLPAVGSEVRGEIDWGRRYNLMRTHTAMHILCGVVFRDYGASVTGGNMDELSGRMDFAFERLAPEVVLEIQARINDEVAAAREVKIDILPRERAFQIPDLIRTKINLLPEGIQQVRTVEIVGLDLQADGGTHVRDTAEVGAIRISKYKSKGGINKRLYVEVGD